MSGTLRTSIARTFRRLAVPLASYYAITLAVPVANGAAQASDTFVKHALVVASVPAVAIVLGCTVLRSLRHVLDAPFSSALHGKVSRRRTNRAP